MKNFWKTKTLVFVLSLAFLGVIAFTSPASFGAILIGGVITSGILGGFSGKVGPVVGGKWKSVDYMRAHVIPANPNSVAQIAQRGAMGQIVAIAKSILSTVINTYWDPFQSAMSGYNAFVKNNISLLAVTTFYLDETLKVSMGSLVPTDDFAAIYTTGTGGLACTWTDNSGVGNALATDDFIITILGKDGTLYGTQESSVNVLDRSDEADSMTIATGLTATDLFAFISFHRGTGGSLLVADSDGAAVSAA